ncbi:PREDICTED: protein ROOT INITIATION DEFECTIVE 3-like [Nelumbo nucifera]|uniref:Protein ROOT INITIATION DEFECTIVE 3-like n=2 Tax=Nelumbo nucifera TaxID=4432 RepID=A0A822XIY1_NELNU|nr:PREDICTED: protein ROOT INITIATION DEFECTIVE 3-like [Nelumbo nucifera]DAD20207.1 TPA_asm: hypothetical protein HUJ06_021670 [Nelumbo nucifera]
MSLCSREILLSSSPDGPIMAYDASSGATLAHFTGSHSPRKGLALAGNTMIAASHISSDTALGSIHLYNWWSSSAFHHLPLPEPVAPLAATPDGLYLFSGGLSGYIHALLLPSGDLLRSFPAHSKPVSCLTINDDGSLLISGGDDGAIAVFPVLTLLDASAGDNFSSCQLTLHRFVGHASSVTSIISGTGGCGSIIVSCSLDCTCKLWSLAQGIHLRTLRFPCMIWGVAMDPTESTLYAGGSDGRVYVAMLKVASSSRQEVGRGSTELVAWTQEAAGGAITAVKMTNTGRNILTASEDGSIRIWEVERGGVIKVFGDGGGSVSDLVVAKGVYESCGRSVRFGAGSVESTGCWSLGFSGRELSRAMGNKVIEMEETLSEVVKDRRRAIGTLETAIGTYERLLELILKEAKEDDTENNGEKNEHDRR